MLLGRGKVRVMIRGRNGFTLPEVLIVVVIIGVLSALIIPRFAAQPERAKAAEAAGILGAIRQGEMAYKLDTGSYLSTPADAVGWAKLGLDSPDSANWTYTIDSGGNGTATRKVGTSVNKTILLSIAGVWGGDHPNVPSN